MWSIGCVIGELLIGRPLFDGNNTMDQLVKIIKVLGSPTKGEMISMKVPEKNRSSLVETEGIGLGTKIKKHLANCPEAIIEFLKKILTYSPEKRLSAK